MLCCDEREDGRARGRGTERGKGRTMNELQKPMRKSELNREQLAVYLAARYALALMQAAALAAVQVGDDLGGRQGGGVRVDGGVPADVLEEPLDGCAG